MSKHGAPAAFRGYRLQSLYILQRILSQGINDYIFYPEGNEDLDVVDTNGNLIESIQVKSYDSLMLSNLDSTETSIASHHSKKVEPFFKRAVNLLKTHSLLTIKLVNFGSVSSEMVQAWANAPLQGKSKAKKTKREIVTEKLKAKGLSQKDIEMVFSRVELVSLDEKSVETEVYRFLRNAHTGMDTQSAFDLLNFWIYLASEQQQKITKSEIINKINDVAKFLADRQAYHTEWFKSIQPIEKQVISEQQNNTLRKEFYAGVSARYEHILAELDFRRYEKLSEIKTLFKSTNVVIIHAASGQGKTALAYRYLYDTYPENWRFSIELIENRQHALSIATALSGYASALEAPVIIYLDVRPGDAAWPELVRQLARHPYLHLLITVREEDFRRANLPAFELDFEDIDLEFNKAEAQLIFERATESQASSKYLDFEAAWDEFRGDGPLLEFVYQLTQTSSLRERLYQQVQRLRHEVREKALFPNELHLLRLVAVATAYEARLNTNKLIEYLELPEPSLTIELYQKEYLIRISADRQHIEALHPIRSQILVGLLTSPDIYPWMDASGQVLPLLTEEDLENFLLHAFLEHTKEYNQLLEVVSGFKPLTWTGLGGIARSLLWAGIRDYIESSRYLIQSVNKMIGDAWWLVLDFDLTNVMNGSVLDWDYIPQENKAKISKIRKLQKPKTEAFKLMSNWLASLTDSPHSPVSHNDWTNLAEIFYWVAHLGAASHIETWIAEKELEYASLNLPLPILADLSMTLYMCNQRRHQEWILKNRSKVETRLNNQYQIIALEEVDDERALKIHFLLLSEEIDEKENKSESSDSFRQATLERLNIVNRLFPNYEKYSTQGYGHKLGNLLQLPFDSTSMNIPRNRLKPLWPKIVNRIALGLAKRNYRPTTWINYVNQIIKTRERVISCIEELRQGVAEYLERKKTSNIFKKNVSKENWNVCHKWLKNLPQLPKIAVDQWGFASETSDKDMPQQELIPDAIVLQKYKTFLKLQCDYLGSMEKFFDQAIHVSVTNSHIGKLSPNKRKRDGLIIMKQLQKNGIRTDFDHTSTRSYWEAALNLKSYQSQFNKMFGHFVESDLLVKLEQLEQELIQSTWQLWYFFANKPYRIITKAIQRVPKNVAVAKQQLDERIQQALNDMDSDDIQVVPINVDIGWDNSPSLWLQMNLNNPIKLHEAFQELISNLKKAFGANDFRALTAYITEQHYEYIVIIPVVRGKMINNLVWPLRTFATIFDSKPIEKKKFSYMMKPMPHDIMKALGLKIWNVKEIDLANQLMANFVNAMFLSAQIYNLKDLPESEEVKVDQDILNTYINKSSKQLSKLIQDYISVEESLLSRFMGLSESVQNQRPNLLDAISVLDNIHSYVVPISDNGQKSLSLDELGKYAQNLEDNIHKAEAVRLLWIADVLEQSE